MRISNLMAGVLAVLALSAAPAAAQGRWRVAYPPAENPEYAALQQHFSEQDILSAMVDPLNEHFPVTRDVTVELVECGREGAFYDAERPAVQLCYELLVNLAQSLMGGGEADGEQVFVGAFAFILLHQVGHALVDVMGFPVTVPPEQAADQLTAVMAAFAPEELQTIAEGALVLAEQGLDWENPGSGRAALSGPRMQNLLCLFYGIDPEGYAWMVDEGHLPAARAEGCTDEIETVKEEWVEYLTPHTQG